MIGIYKITSPKGRIYIGQSVNLENRILSYRNINVSKKQTVLHNSLKKYGYNNHKFEIIHECESTELNNFERYYQDLFKCINKNGLNCTLTKSTDMSGKISESTLLKLSKIRKGKQWSLGRVFSAETKNKMSLKAKERGLHKSFMEASKKANTGRKHTKECRLKISEKQKKITHIQYIEIKKLLKNGVFQKDIANIYNVSQRTICSVNLGIYIPKGYGLL